ncbi:MAG: pseudaminic acid cytidylyltransferase [Lachnospiraceae bacterium]|nr:pseudaminic acid cytidylyltransferase [Lachnospiraceae bacterium]
MPTKNLAIITARGGSKRIPGKNIREFCGKPILFYSIEAALASGVFAEVMVSTDDQEIARLAVEAGAVVPFMRSEATAGDFASTDEVIYEVLQEYEKRGKQFEAFCCIYPTAPFLTPKRLKEAMGLLQEADSVMPVVPFSYPPQRGLIIDQNGYVRRKYPEYATARSQDLEKMYHDCGQFYACRTAPFLREKTTDVEGLVPLYLSEMEVQDIDTPEDWELAELKYRKLFQKD